MDLYDKLNLNEIVELVRIIAYAKNIDDYEKTIYNGDIIYNITKLNNKIIISSSEGKMLEVSCYDETKVSKDKHEYTDHIVDVNYKLSENEHLNLLSNVSYDYYYSLANILRHNLYECYRLDYLKDNIKDAELTFGFDTIKLDNNKTYEIDNNRIKEGNKIISLEDNKLLKLYGKDLPSMEIINSFNFSKEQEILKQYMDNKKLHPFTRDVIEDSFKLLNNKNKLIDEIKTYYKDDIKNVEKAKNIRVRVQNGINNNLFTKEELSMVIEALKDYIFGNDSKKLVKKY